MTDGEFQCEYKPRVRSALLGIAFFGACSAVFIHLARTSENGAVVNGLIHLTPFQAQVVFAILAVTSGVFVALGFLMLVQRAVMRQRVAITLSHITLPTGRWLHSQHATIAFEDIESVKIINTHGQRFLYVYAHGLRYTLIAGWLPNDETLDIVVHFLSRRMKQSL
jgi:hypothetical protein